MKRAFLFALLGALTTRSVASEAFVWPNVPYEIARELQSDDVATRRAAADRILELPVGVAAPHVLTALEDVDAQVRLAAARAAVELRVHGAGERVVEWLADGDVRLRLAACEVLRLSTAPRALPPLSRVLGDGDAQVRAAAAATLGMMGSTEAVPPLLGHLDDPSIEARTAIIEALGRIGDDSAVVPLLGKVQDNAPEVRRMTVRVLGDLGNPQASSALMLALQDMNEDVRVEAVDSLGRLRARDAISALAPLTKASASARVREAAAEALGRIGGEDAVGPLLDALDRDNPSNKRSAVRQALAQQGPSLIPRLVSTVSQSQSSNVMSGCVLVLGDIGSSDGIPFIVGVMQQSKVPAAIGLEALARLGEPAALPYVLELLDAPSSTERLAAIVAAERLMDPSRRDGRPVDPIAARLTVPGLDVAERIALARLLGKTGSPRAAKTLVGLVRSKDRQVKQTAIAALGNLGPASQDSVLLEALDDTDPSVRMTAAIALSQSSSPSTAMVIFRRLLVGSEQDRVALGIALSGAMVRSDDENLVAELVKRIDGVRAQTRDVFIEGLGRSGSASAGRALVELANSRVADDRRKVAESLSGHPVQINALRRLLGDADSSVQASAVWSLGLVGDSTDVRRLVSMAMHRDVGVASNAVGAMGRLISQGKVRSVKPLCDVLGDSRPYVRANALAGLRVARKRCEDGAIERGLLGSDPSVAVRVRAAELLWNVPSSVPAADERGLRRCLLDDRSGEVAVACRGGYERRNRAGGLTEPVLVFVVPEGRVQPQGRVPFTLVFEDGRMRTGLADRRGAVFEGAAPRGEVQLAVPAARVLSQ